MPDFDVIGAGPAGEVLAGRTAAAGLSTAILEERRPRDLAGALRTAFDHEGSALVEVMVARQRSRHFPHVHGSEDRAATPPIGVPVIAGITTWRCVLYRQ